MLSDKNKTSKFTAKEIVCISLFAALIIVCSLIQIPAPVPFTMQTFAVFCTYGILGGRKGAWSVAVYILLGFIGLPVFSGFQGGAGVLFGATGGYIFGFLLSAQMYGLITKLTGKNTVPVMAIAMAAGQLLCYLTGTLWYVAVYADDGVMYALKYCVLPFLLTDTVKIVLAAVTADRVVRRVKSL